MFIEELKRRNIIRLGAAYLALFWVVIEISGAVVPALHLPDWSTTMLVWLGVVGLPFVLVFAWVYELTPEGLKRESEVVRDDSITQLTARRLDTAIIALLVIALGLFGYHEFRAPPQNVVAERAGESAVSDSAGSAGTTAPGEAQAQQSAPTAPAQAFAPDQRAIAVLPFQNRSRLEDDAFFVDGIHDDILSQLAKIGALKVISRTSVERFRHTELAIKDIATQLGVSKILEGAVQRAGERVRITVQLIDAPSDAHLWTETYDRELNTANLFAIQSEVAQAISTALAATLTEDEKARVNAVPTKSLEAWEAYQLGKQRMARRTSGGLAEAKQFFDKAVALDPQFALAHVGLADTLQLQWSYSGAARADIFVVAHAAANRALEIDPGLGEAFASLGLLLWNENHPDRAESMFRRAIERAPNYATAHQWYGQFLLAQSRVREALAELQRALELDPLSAIVNVNLVAAYEANGRFDDAERTARKVIEIDPSAPIGYETLAFQKALAFNRFTEALPLQERAVAVDPDSPRGYANLVALYADLGDAVAVERNLDVLRTRWPNDENTFFAAMFAELNRGNADGAVPWAARMLAVNPVEDNSLFVLCLADRKAGRPDAALKRYLEAIPQLREPSMFNVSSINVLATLETASLLQQAGEHEDAEALLQRFEAFRNSVPRLGLNGFGFADAQLFAVRGDKQAALRALREGANAGVRGAWRFYRDYGPGFDTIRNDPEFKAIFADIERDMAAQRAALAKASEGD